MAQARRLQVMDKITRTYRSFILLFQNFFPLSFKVDLILFLLGLKPGLRSKLIKSGINFISFQQWCSQSRYFFEIDSEEFIYIAKNNYLLIKLKKWDHCYQPHEEHLGKLLGYPSCCCKKIAEIGEMNIDAFEAAFVRQPFSGAFQLINPLGYREGTAFISHVPCSSNCLQSLKQAEKLANFLLRNKTEKLFEPWLIQLENIYKKNFINEGK